MKKKLILTILILALISITALSAVYIFYLTPPQKIKRNTKIQFSPSKSESITMPYPEEIISP